MKIAVEGVSAGQLRRAVAGTVRTKTLPHRLRLGTLAIDLPSGTIEFGALGDIGNLNVARFSGTLSTVAVQLDRIVGALLREPGITPIADEYWMSLAKTVAQRSSSSRMAVGAVIIKDEAVISIGANEVPLEGGRLAWSDDPHDSRDFKTIGVPGLDRRGIVQDLLGREGHGPDANLVGRLSSSVLGLIDVERAVHAEVAAVADAAKRGVPTLAATMYVTHEPCYRCQRVLTASGIERIIFDESIEWKIPLELLELMESKLQVSRFIGIRWDIVQAIRAAMHAEAN